VNTSGSFAYLGWPLVVIGGFAVMVGLLRWAFSPGHSLVQRRPKSGSPGEYGLLVAVATPSTYIEGEMLRLRLLESGVRGTLVTTTEGPRLMVFDRDASVARALLLSPPPSP
jgi:FtsP/CotA-like multicopper oxidase with cupredoxin domain